MIQHAIFKGVFQNGICSNYTNFLLNFYAYSQIVSDNDRSPGK